MTAVAGARGNDTLDGQNLLPLLQEQAGFPPRPLYWHYPHYSNQGGKPSGAIRDGHWKLIEFYEDRHTELFDLVDDPSESRDISLQHPQIVKRLAASLAEWRTHTGAKMPTPNPDYSGSRQKR